MVKPTVFIVEDDSDISRLVRHHLEASHYPTRIFPSGSRVIAEAEAVPPSLFILDVMIPGKDDGFALCRAIRRSRFLATIPIIFLTARTSEADRIRGLDAGADDYIAKPFSPRELLARVKAVFRRLDVGPAPSGPMRVGDLEIDPIGMVLKVRGEHFPTTATEFRLLNHFARNVGRVFTRDQLLDSIWRENSFVTTRSVDVYVRRVREKIESDPENPVYLRTVRGIGYRLDARGSV